MTVSNRLGITELAETQNNRSVTINEAIAKLEAGATFFAAIQVLLNAPPVSPAEGDLYVVGTAGTGDWSGHSENVAFYYNAAWLFFAPIEGMFAWDQTSNSLKYYDGADWVAYTPPGSSIGKQTISIPASAMLAATTSGPASAHLESSSNKINYSVLDFDASADEHAHFSVAFPKSWDEGTVTFQVFWTTSATDTDGVAWGLQAVAVSDNEAIDASWGTPVVVTDDAQSAALEMLVTAESSAVTIGGSPAAGDLVYFRIFRDVSDANDDMTEDARLISIKLFYTTDAGTDA